ncbi:MAG: flagellar biosynthetic protein FliR [Planctomycetota bacterium]
MTELVDQAAPFFLVVVRLSGIFIVSPLLGSSSILPRSKALLAVGMAAAIYPSLPEHTRFPLDVSLFGLLPLIVLELLIGYVIGTVAALPALGAQMGGQVIGYEMGLSLAQSFNPELETNADVIGQLFFFAGTTLFVISGGVDAMYSVLVATFEMVPPGGFVTGMAPLELYLGSLNAAMELALRISAPVVAIALLSLLAMGFIMKSMPAMNILAVGFAIKILAGFAILIPAAGLLLSLAFELQEDAVMELRRWAATLAEG